MTPNEFVREFSEESFPAEFGPWIDRDDHDPPFTLALLRKMAKNGVIELREATKDEPKTKYRLTLISCRYRGQD